MGNRTERSGPTPPAGEAPRRWSFGAAALDERSMRLFVDGRAVELEPGPLALLRCLLRHSGQAVSNDDLVKAAWPGREIGDAALAGAVARLREALGEAGHSIRTVHGFGYRLEGEVRSADALASAAPGEGGSTRSRAGSQPSRRLAAIMFTDLVGYSALAHRDEALAIELLELHRGWIRAILPEHGGIEIETVGDAFLVEFSGALAAVECAVAIHNRFAAHNAAAPEARRMQLRIGIHLGDVEHKDGKLMGDGVNIASRIHGEAEPGGICVSEQVCSAVRNRGFEFEGIGSPALKNIETAVALYRWAAPGSRSTLARRLGRGFRRRRVALVTAGVIAATVAVALTWRQRLATAEEIPSVAVLPFAGLSAGAEDQYFSDGVHDAVIAHLARIRRLKTISRTSVMGYRDTRANLREVARQLKVAHIVEGSVQRAAARVRVTVQLIRAADDAHLWAETYDREIADIFAIQSDIAQNVASRVEAILTPAERRRLATRVSVDPAAYDLYLQAARLYREGYVLPAEVAQMQGLLERAVAIDAGFALAHAVLGRTHLMQVWWNYDNSPQRRELAKRAIDVAQALDPDLPEARRALGYYHYWGFRDYARALEQFSAALEAEPNSPETLEAIAYVQRRLGRWQEALAHFEQVIELDPLNSFVTRELAITHHSLRDYAVAARYYARALALSPDSPGAAAAEAYTHVLSRGDLGPLRRFVERTRTVDDSGGIVADARIALARYEGRFDDAVALLQRSPGPWYGGAGGFARAPVSYLIGELAHAAGDGALARRRFGEARSLLDEEVRRRPDAAPEQALLAVALAALGEAEAARAAARSALEGMPPARDAVVAPSVRGAVALAYCYLGDRPAALDLIEELLEVPYGLHAHELKLEPAWRPLHGDPRFEQLVARHLPKS